ncbi:MAG TPA: hypothetical protein DC038_08200 [Clostridiales bacterium]|nr:hypothetical protein [Clostridiales bacterium]
MSRIKDFFAKTASNVKSTIFRFPVVLIYLAFLSTVMFIMIERDYINDELLGRLFFTGMFGTLMAMAVQFMLERFRNLSRYTLIFHVGTVILSVVYYFFMTDISMSQSMVVHFLVISFALTAAYLYMPSAGGSADFNKVALSHFKAAVTAILYGIVMFLGFVAILGAIDILLYSFDSIIYAHTANIIYTFFTPVYYLSLLPKFNSDEEDDIDKKEVSYSYPRVLDILVSYILIPLISIFSVVLIAYFIKIIFTGVWPVGQVGPMVLAYSGTGWFIYILCSDLKNRFSVFFRKAFPPVLIPLAAMQLVSSYIRIEAYGITESRYYVVLFGVFSIICALVLIFRKNRNSNIIVLLAAIFALLSIAPPIDAFTVSRYSQELRLEEILTRNGMLFEDKIIPNKTVSNNDKFEITSISNYMSRMGYLEEVEWFPKEYATDSKYYSGFEQIYGFLPYYDRYEPAPGEAQRYVYARLDENQNIDIAGFDKFIRVNITSSREYVESGSFLLDNNKYVIKQKSDGAGDITVSIFDENGSREIDISLKELVDRLFANSSGSKSLMTQEELTVTEQNEKLNIKITVTDINADRTNDSIYISGSMFVFISLK